jgi:hypothetical protein
MKITKKQFRQILIKELEDAFRTFDRDDWLKRACPGPKCPDDEEGGEKLSKEIPLSITKQQKKVPELEMKPGVWEQSFRVYLQKVMKLPPEHAERLARNVYGALKARKIPVAESNLYQAAEDILLEKMQKVSSRKDVKKLAAAGLKPGGIFNRGGNWWFAWNPEGSEVRKYADKQLALAWAGQIKKEPEERKPVTATGEYSEKDLGLIGRIIMKHVQRRASDDPGFMEKFTSEIDLQKKFIKDLEKIIIRQMARRQYEKGEIKKALAEVKK